MKNKVFLNKDGIIETVYHGDQNKRSINTVINAYHKFSKVLRERKKNVILLVNFVDIGNIDLLGRSAAIQGINSLDFDKIAAFGGNSFLKNMTNLVVKAMRRSDRIKYFDNREDAEEWLKGDEF